MYTVYVLKDNEGKIYKGMTNNIDRRIIEHKSGKTKTTKYMDEVKVAYKEEYKIFDEARKRELYFKSAVGRRFLKDKI